MNKAVELPIVQPMYSARHSQGGGGAILKNNPSIRNWYLNRILILQCNRKFLKGFTSPELDIEESSWYDNPHLIKKWYETRYLKGYINPLIRELLSDGHYVVFGGVDDYYVPGKSWYRERHFAHDGLICGYDQTEKTYSLFAYDSRWIYRVFQTTQKGWNAGREAMFRKGTYGYLCSMKPQEEEVLLEPKTILVKLREYLDSSLEKYPLDGTGIVSGIVVQEYVAMYLDKLADGSIPYERMDRRVFRWIWEHKAVMAERLERVEQAVQMDSTISRQYGALVSQANTMRMLYAAHHMKRRDAVLPVLQKQLLTLRDEEERLLTEFVYKLGGILQT